MIAAIVERLKGQCGLRLVEGALELADIDSPGQAPAAYVMDISDSAPPAPRVIGPARQRVTTVVGVLLILRSAGRAPGKVQDTQALAAAVRTRLVGYAPAGCEPLAYVGGATVDVRPHEVWRLLRFSTSFLITGAS